MSPCCFYEWRLVVAELDVGTEATTHGVTSISQPWQSTCVRPQQPTLASYRGLGEHLLSERTCWATCWVTTPGEPLLGKLPVGASTLGREFFFRLGSVPVCCYGTTKLLY